MVGVCVMAAGAGVRVCAAADDVATLEKQFTEVPMEARRLTGPLFWLHGTESRARLETVLGKVAEGHNGTFTAESRPHNDWLGPKWYEDLAVCLESAKRLNLTMWIFDEKWWPSGEVGRKLPPEYGSKTMVAEATSVDGPKAVKVEGCGGPQFIAAVAGKEIEGGVDGASLVDLAGFVKDGVLSWDAPAGQWKVMKFTWKFTAGKRLIVDGASKDCVDWYIKTVYQPHYDHFKDEFGKTIKGYFYDEPETPGDWGTEVLPMLAERKVDWKKPLVAWKFPLAGDEQAAAKYQYQDAFAEAWGRTLYGGLQTWCKAHHVESMGHFLEHALEYLRPNLCAGNMFQLQKYSAMGALDAVFRQFAPGQRVTRDAPVWQTPKLASSITHAYGKPDDRTMVEIFGARGQDLGYPEMKWWADHMQVSGVNFLIPHSFNPKAPYDTDCPPYFYNGGYEPRFALYRVFADYTSRLSLWLTGGRHVCPVALLFLGNSYHVGKAIPPEQMSEALQDALYDCDWIPYDVFENDTKLADGAVTLRQESYRVLIVPPVEVIPYETLAKAKAFFDAGGIVIGYGFLPAKSATLGHTSQEIVALADAIWGNGEAGLAVRKSSARGGRSFFLAEKPSPADLKTALAANAGVRPALEVVEGETRGWVHILHRAKAGCNVFLVCNQNHEGAARKFKFRTTVAGKPERWDAVRNEISAVEFKRDAAGTAEFEMTLEPNESALLVFAAEGTPRKARIEDLGAPARTIEVVREPFAGPQPPSRPPEAEEEKPAAPVKAVGLEGCPWVWFPGENGRNAAPPGPRYFRHEITLGDRKVTEAKFTLSCDNEFTLFVNGKEAGKDDTGDNSWDRPQTINVAKYLKPGTNALAIVAVNGGSDPNPAGLIGKYTITCESGAPVTGSVDKTWRASKQEPPGWKAAGFDDKSWAAAEVVAKFGDAPWGRIAGGGKRGRQLTVSPITADLFQGRCTVPADVDLAKSRAVLVLDGLPDGCAAVTINGEFAGGLIGEPLRLDVTRQVKRGENVLLIAPLAPKSARLMIFREKN
jgi:hypothetical protein